MNSRLLKYSNSSDDREFRKRLISPVAQSLVYPRKPFARRFFRVRTTRTGTIPQAWNRRCWGNKEQSQPQWDVKQLL